MRGKKAKLMRRATYRDSAHKSFQVRKQAQDNGVVVNTGLRKYYQDLKKAFRKRNSITKRTFLRGV